MRVPESWGDTAAAILAWRYARYTDDIQETDAEDIFHRLATWWAHWAVQTGTLEQHEARDYVRRVVGQLERQEWAPNSPQWFNAGIAQAHGLRGTPRGHWACDGQGGVEPCTDEYTRPQISACFIQRAVDSLDGIMDLAVRETRVFRSGGGSGSNFTPWRAEHTPISAGGTSSGLISFLSILDAGAGAIKSGGTTRRAAKMAVVDSEHADAAQFVDLKASEETGVLAEIIGRHILREYVRTGEVPNVPARARKAIEEHTAQDLTASWADGDTGSDVLRAYGRAKGQNANNSLRVRDSFMQAARLHNSPEGALLRKAARAAWVSGDPGLQFADAINRAHTCPEDGEIHASNPCSEYFFLDDTACNLGSINLAKFVSHGGPGVEIGGGLRIRIDEFRATVRDMMIALDASVSGAGYPHRDIAQGSVNYRTVGVGYAALGEVLVRGGIPYESETALHVTEQISALLGATTWATSAELASKAGSFPRYEVNAEHLQRVLRDKARAASESKLLAADAWAQALQAVAAHGARHAQTTVIAPTGTIGLVMGCDTTGIEPLFAAATIKHLEGGGTIEFRPECVEHALEHFGPGPWICGSGDVSPQGHIDIVAAAQTYIDGGISKTVNMPRSATVEDVHQVFTYAHKRGLKCVALYRDGCKLMQPLTSAGCPECGAEQGPIPDGACAICPECGHREGGCG